MSISMTRVFACRLIAGRLAASAVLAFIACAGPAHALENDDPPISAGSHFEEQDGATLYRGICQACHMPEGQGAHSGSGAYPALKANPRLVAPAYPIYNILHGKGGMPPLGQWLSDTQIADLVNYLRTHFDNHYTDTVGPEDVKKLR